MIKYYYRKYLLRGWPDVSAIGGPLERHTQTFFILLSKPMVKGE